jgi:hypothetical protein
MKNVIFTLVLIICLACACVFFGRPVLAPGVTKQSIQSIQPGMNAQEVLDCLGQPIKKDAFTWIYGKSGFWGQGYEVYLNFSNDIVRRIAVECFDLGIYWHEEGKQPVIQDSRQFNKMP